MLTRVQSDANVRSPYTLSLSLSLFPPLQARGGEGNLEALPPRPIDELRGGGRNLEAEPCGGSSDRRATSHSTDSVTARCPYWLCSLSLSLQVTIEPSSNGPPRGSASAGAKFVGRTRALWEREGPAERERERQLRERGRAESRKRERRGEEI